MTSRGWIARLVSAGVISLTVGRLIGAAPTDVESTAPLDYSVAFPSAPVRLPQLLGDHAVLQRDRRIAIWGWGEFGKTVSVEVADSKTTTLVNTQNLWATTIGPLKAGGPYNLIAGDGITTAVSRDVLVGDVWLCGGQSNMEQALGGVANAEHEVASARNARLRLFQVPRTTALSPQSEFAPDANWAPCSSEVARRISAIGYFMGDRLQKQLDVPVGIISATWVNTTIQLWMSEAGASQFGDFNWWIEQLRRTSTPPGRAKLDDDARWKQWVSMLQDTAEGSTGTRTWYDPEMRIDSQWKRMRLPTAWERAGLKDFDGVVWFRKDVKLPGNWAGTTATLSLGHIYDYSTIWWNGEKVGTSADWKTTTVRAIPGQLVRRGRNTIAARVLDTEFYGGIGGTTDSLCLETTMSEGYTSLSLAGEWRYRVGLNIKDAPKRPWRSTEQWPHPAAMYNAMIAPIVSHDIRGVVWYQGEADAYQALRYRELLSAFIRDWRARWKQPRLPFVIAQLASCLGEPEKPEESQWAVVRESQDYVSRRMDRVGMAAMYDLGGTTEPHFLRKREAAERLTSAALAVAYGQNVNYRGPQYKKASMRVRGRKVRVTFENTTSGLEVRGDELKGFAISGKDRKFYWAKAELVSTNTVELSSEKVGRPVAVRFGWAYHPHATLFSKAGLPAEPFRTDKWVSPIEGRMFF